MSLLAAKAVCTSPDSERIKQRGLGSQGPSGILDGSLPLEGQMGPEMAIPGDV